MSESKEIEIRSVLKDVLSDRDRLVLVKDFSGVKEMSVEKLDEALKQIGVDGEEERKEMIRLILVGDETETK